MTICIVDDNVKEKFHKKEVRMSNRNLREKFICWYIKTQIPGNSVLENTFIENMAVKNELEEYLFIHIDGIIFNFNNLHKEADLEFHPHSSTHIDLAFEIANRLEAEFLLVA